MWQLFSRRWAHVLNLVHVLKIVLTSLHLDMCAYGNINVVVLVFCKLKLAAKSFILTD